MIQHVFSDTGGTRSIEIDGCHHRRIIRNEKIPVDRRKEGNQHIGRNAQCHAQRKQGTDGCRLTEQQDRHDKKRNTEKPRHIGHQTKYIFFDNGNVTGDKGIAHPCNTENGHYCLHTRIENRTLGGLHPTGAGQQQNQCGYRQHEHFNDVRHLHHHYPLIGLE